MSPIAVFFHCAANIKNVPALHPLSVVREQMEALNKSGLVNSAAEILIGVNGNGVQVNPYLSKFPEKAQPVMHGPDSMSENATILLIERWAKSHPGWHVCYFHAKGSSVLNPAATDWRRCMTGKLVTNWQKCVEALESGKEAVGCHWVRGLDATQHYFAGNCWWAESDFLNTLPSILDRGCIKKYGLLSAKCRYEAEVWLGNGKRLPKILDFHPGWPHHGYC